MRRRCSAARWSASCRRAGAHSMRRWCAASPPRTTTQRKMRQGRRVELLRADGSTVPVEIALSRIEMIDQGRPRTLFAAMLRDTSDALALEAATGRAGAPHARGVRTLADRHLDLRRRRLVYANRAAVRLFDAASVDGLIGQRVWSLLDDDSHALLAPGDRAHPGRPDRRRHRRRPADARQRRARARSRSRWPPCPTMATARCRWWSATSPSAGARPDLERSRRPARALGQRRRGARGRAPPHRPRAARRTRPAPDGA